MRASRLLQMLLLLQNRGRMTSADLAHELEVDRRTVLRDVDALTEAGLPMVVRQGQGGGIELGFDYRTRLTGLAADEAEAIGVILARPLDELRAVGMADAGTRATRKLIESFPDAVRARVMEGRRRFRFHSPTPRRAEEDADDPRIPALAGAIRTHQIVRIRAYETTQRVLHPVALVCDAHGWAVEDDVVAGELVRLDECGHVNISAQRFTPRNRADSEHYR